MKKSFLFLAATLCALTIQAQSDSGFGIKGGLNYNGNGNYFESIEAAAKDPDRNLGFHVGLYGKFGNKLYFRPEAVYTSTKSDYDGQDFKMQKLDIPLLVGLKVLGPVSVFGGPSLQYILDSEFENISINDIENDFSVGLNFGAALSFDAFGVDLRYERGFNNNEARFVNNNFGQDAVARLDTRPEQLILSLSVKF